MYRDIYRRSLEDPEGFWLEAARAVDWEVPPTRALGGADPLYEWYPGATISTAWNAVDRHVAAGRGDQAAVIHHSPMTDSVTTITYAELKDRTARLAGALAARGVGRGDRVVIYMPMMAEAVVAMLACARLGAIHSVVFGGFAAPELAKRIDDAKPKAILAASCGLEPGRVVHYKPLLDGALEIAAHAPEFSVIVQRPQEAAALGPRDHEWEAFQAGAAPADPVAIPATDPLYILYTSGTTGQPKGVVRPAGGHAVALTWSMPNVFGVGPGDVMFTGSDVGWVVGHSYIVYAPLLVGATTVVFEGKPVGTPDAAAFWRVVAQHRAKVIFTAPTAFRAIRRDDPAAALLSGHDVSSLEALYLAGERADPDTIAWAEAVLKVPVIDNWWQTETGWPIAANPRGIEMLPVKTGSPALPMPGYDVRVLDEGGHPVPPGDLGAIAIKLPLPPGTLPTLWGDEARFRRSYLEHFRGYYETGDAGMIDADGYIHVMARTDDVINVAGHRLSTGAMEEVLATHPDVAECAVIGVHDPLKGQAPVGLVCLSRGVETPEPEVAKACIQLVRNKIGPVAAFKTVAVVERLPKTRSGKILRGTLVKIADGQDWAMPATVDDPAIFEEIGAVFARLGLGPRA